MNKTKSSEPRNGYDKYKLMKEYSVLMKKDNNLDYEIQVGIDKIFEEIAKKEGETQKTWLKASEIWNEKDGSEYKKQIYDVFMPRAKRLARYFEKLKKKVKRSKINYSEIVKGYDDLLDQMPYPKNHRTLLQEIDSKIIAYKKVI